MIRYKYLDILAGIFITVILVSNVVTVKIFKVGPLTFDGGTALFPLAYIFGDVFTEVYGYKNNRRIIWIGFLVNVIMAISFIVIGKLPATRGWENQICYDAILNRVPRIVVASIIAYWIGSFSNAYILSKMKIWSKGKALWMRTIGSTIVGEFLDTIFFCLIAFWGQIPIKLLLTVIISNYILKVSVEVFFTPITYKIVKLLKKHEAIDIYDYNTQFNPFILDNTNNKK
jgi:hypothetical protein